MLNLCVVETGMDDVVGDFGNFGWNFGVYFDMDNGLIDYDCVNLVC